VPSRIGRLANAGQRPARCARSGTPHGPPLTLLAAHLSVLDTLGVAAAVGVAVQLLAIDDPLSWFSAACVAALLGAGDGRADRWPPGSSPTPSPRCR
jgi:hypothetical protein